MMERSRAVNRFGWKTRRQIHRLDLGFHDGSEKTEVQVSPRHGRHVPRGDDIQPPGLGIRRIHEELSLAGAHAIEFSNDIGRKKFFPHRSAENDPVLHLNEVEVRGEGEGGKRRIYETAAQVDRGFLLELGYADGFCRGAVVPECADLLSYRLLPPGDKLGAQAAEVELLHRRRPEPAAHRASQRELRGEVQLCGKLAVECRAEVAVVLIAH